ncbi:hypothetical protein PVAP13_9NG072573 [Panicum virgatum]|uniref:Uncharacterized protein n=1 Tax=Panicum virgatum TaxID=38727 RepID=A0A8T0MCP3_PANVG|nr:hypothetical protein PVAP13_9NG072573 [Panicum virgatum]
MLHVSVLPPLLPTAPLSRPGSERKGGSNAADHRAQEGEREDGAAAMAPAAARARRGGAQGRRTSVRQICASAREEGGGGRSVRRPAAPCSEGARGGGAARQERREERTALAATPPLQLGRAAMASTAVHRDEELLLELAPSRGHAPSAPPSRGRACRRRARARREQRRAREVERGPTGRGGRGRCWQGSSRAAHPPPWPQLREEGGAVGAQGGRTEGRAGRRWCPASPGGPHSGTFEGGPRGSDRPGGSSARVAEPLELIWFKCVKPNHYR